MKREKPHRRLVDIYQTIFILIGLIFSGCTDEPETTDKLPIRPLIQVTAKYDSDRWFNSPVNPPEYLIINSARDMANLPEGTLSESAVWDFRKIDYAKKTLIVVTSVIYCEPSDDEDRWNWANANFELTKNYQLNIRYSNCSVLPDTQYSVKCKIQFGFTMDKIPSDSKITITESMITKIAGK